MHPYVPYLLEDIAAAHCHTPINEIRKSVLFDEDMEDLEKWIRGENEHPLSYFTGLKKEHFPPAELLSSADMNSILLAFDQMLSTWNADIVYPERMPVSKRYEFLRDTVLEENFSLITFGHITLDYCTGSSDGCAWGEYCTCRDKDEREGGF